jgi:hypothetical protein
MPKCPSACYFEEVDDLRHECEAEEGHAGQHVASGNNGDGFTWNDASACVFTRDDRPHVHTCSRVRKAAKS